MAQIVTETSPLHAQSLAACDIELWMEVLQMQHHQPGQVTNS
jgi:hypothetical protein